MITKDVKFLEISDNIVTEISTLNGNIFEIIQNQSIDPDDYYADLLTVVLERVKIINRFLCQ